MKRLSLWAGLLVIFFVVYAVTSRPGPPAAFDWKTFIPMMTVVFFVLFGFFVWRNMRWVKAHNEGVALVTRGRHAEAIERFEATCKLTPIALPALNLANAQLALWRIPAAILTLADYENRAKSMRGMTPGTAALGASTSAIAHALAGDSARAIAALEKSETLGGMTATGRLAEVVLACRAGEWARSRALITANGVQLDQLGGSSRALLDVLTAWTASHLGGEGAQVSAVRVFGETGPDGLRAVWPEVVAFIERVEAGPKPS